MTVYMKYTDKKGSSSVQAHQVWPGKERFIALRKAEWEKEGGSAVEVDVQTYRTANWSKK